MRRLLDLFKSLLIGGFLFLLPLGVIIVVFGKLLSIARRLGEVLHKWLLPGAQSEALVLAFAIFVLVLIALVAGIVAQTAAGRRIFGWFERALLSYFPFYTLFRQLIPDTSETATPLGESRKSPVVTAHLDDQTLVGFLVDTTPDGKKVIYLPGAPTALSGTVMIMDADRVQETALKPQQFLRGLRRLGTGMSEIAAKSRE